MEWVNLVLTSPEERNLAISLQYPKSLKELGYYGVCLAKNDFYRSLGIRIILLKIDGNRYEKLDLKAQLLPNLKLFKVSDTYFINGRATEFLAMNPNVEVVDYYTKEKYN
jgi:hypothetical protein